MRHDVEQFFLGDVDRWVLVLYITDNLLAERLIFFGLRLSFIVVSSDWRFDNLREDIDPLVLCDKPLMTVRGDD